MTATLLAVTSVILDMTAVILDMTAVILNMTPVILHVTAVILNMTAVILHVTGVILNMTPVILNKTAVILRVTGVILNVTAVILNVTAVILNVTPVILRMTPVMFNMTAVSRGLPSRLDRRVRRRRQRLHQHSVAGGADPQLAVDDARGGDVAGRDGDVHDLELAGLAVEQANGIAAHQQGRAALVAGRQQAGGLAEKLDPIAVGAGAGEDAARTPEEKLAAEPLQPAAREGGRDGVVGVRGQAVDRLRVAHPQGIAVEGDRARHAVLEGAAGEELPLELVEAVRRAGEQPRTLGDELLDPPCSQVAHPVPAVAAALEEPLLGGREDAPLVNGEVEHRGQHGEAAERLAAVLRRVDPGGRTRVVDRHQDLVADGADGGDASVDHPRAGRPHRASAVVGDPGAGALGAQDHPLRARRMVGDGVDGEARVPHPAPGLAAVVREVEAGDGAGEQPAARQGGEARGAALLEAVLEALPLAAAVLRAVHPAAGAGPDLPRLARHRGESEQLGVEDHALEDARPGLAAVVAAVGTPPGAGDHRLRLIRIDQQAGDLLHLGEVGRQRPPGLAVVLAAVDPGRGAGVEAPLPARHQGQRVDRLVRQPLSGAGDPGLAEVVRGGDVATPEDAP